jgi:FMN phosphatase YigB (HAD superfamily)
MEKNWQPKAILFDLLTALLNSWSTWDAAAGADAKLGYIWRKRYLELTFGCGTYKPYEELTAQSARDVGLNDKAAKLLLEKWETLEPWPEVPGVLKKLKEQGYRLGVVTNCSIVLGRKAAERVGVELDAVVTAEEAGYVKPIHLKLCLEMDAANQ